MKRRMPEARQGRPEGVKLQWDLVPKALEAWTPTLVAAKGPASAADDNVISIYDPIGYDSWDGSGVTANRIAGALRLIGASKDVVVNINSPGGDMFEGLAIYNLLRQHKGDVTVRILGLAASAASVIAMAGDKIEIARAGFLMIHDCWMIAMGNRIDFRAVADTLEPFDQAMASIYAARTGEKEGAMLALMDAETWIGGQAAVDDGFADDLLEADQVTEQARTDGKIAGHLIDMVLAKAGLPRSQRREMLQEFKASKPRAAGNDADTPGAVPAEEEVVTPSADAELLESLRAFSFTEQMAALRAPL